MNPQQFRNLKNKSLEFRNDSASDRIQRLNKIKTWIKNNESKILDALKADFSKPHFETIASEILPVLSEIDFFKKNLKQWMKDQTVPTPISLLGHKSSIRHENKGVILIISPWNYPFYLSIAPLVAALGAGNTAVIKPSELTPETSLVVQKLVADCFSDDEVTVQLGDKTVSEQLLGYNFDHVFFTGSTQVGRIIAKTCAEKLIPVTLELGGKSPTIVDRTADLDLAASRIFWGKFLNRGQTCVAPDYVLVHQEIHSEFLRKLDELNKKHQSSIEGQIISDRHEQRLSNLGSVISGYFKKIPLQIKTVTNASDPSMTDEIFGPVLPVLTFSNDLEVDQILDQHPKPLSLYVFSKQNDFIERILRRHTSGSVGINTLIVQLANPNLPFGGVGTSGIGRYHGYHGFVELSHTRAILKLNFFHFISGMLLPPYTPLKTALLNLIKRAQ